MSSYRRSPAFRQAVLETLTGELAQAVADGRARVTRSGRVVPAAPQSNTRAPFAAGVSLADNPNRGKRHCGRLPGRASDDPVILRDRARGEAVVIARPHAYHPLTVSTPQRDSLGRKRPRDMGYSSYTV